MILKNKVAVIYGAGGAIGGAVARAFAREGAKVFLAGRHQAGPAAALELITSGAPTASSTAARMWVLVT